MASMSVDGQVPRRAVLSLVLKLPERKTARVVGRMITQKQIRSSAVFTVMKEAWASFG